MLVAVVPVVVVVVVLLVVFALSELLKNTSFGSINISVLLSLDLIKILFFLNCCTDLIFGSLSGSVNKNTSFDKR